MATSIRASLPASYTRLLSDFFDRPKVEEHRATCERCSMCDHGEPSPVAMDYFDPTTKCCTFWPMLPNYLVGAILADDAPDMAVGKSRIRKVIQSRIAVTPGAVTRPRKWSFLMVAYGEAFGRTKSLKCPYYDDDNPVGNCSIWRHRETVCHTYYCRYNSGSRGFEYWSALKNYLAYVQRVLAKSAATVVDPKVIEPQFKRNLLSAEDMDDLPPKESDYKAWWGTWVGREEEFYLRCHEFVKTVTATEFAKIVDGSEEGKKLFDQLVAKYDAMENKILPKSLVKNGRMREQHADGKVVVTSYHRYDPIAIDKDLFDVVGMFKADQTLDENLERLRTEDGIELTPELIEFLFAAGVLVEPSKAKVSGAKEVSAEVAAERNGRRAALRAVLEARGLAADDAQKGKIDAADASTLDLWIKKAVVAKTVGEVLD